MTTVSEPASQIVEAAKVPRPYPWRQCAAAAGVPTILTALHATYYGRWIVDDAGLTFAYARSLATGAGPVLQPGAEPVEGYSNPAWVAVLVVGRWLHLFDRGAWFGISDIVLFPKVVALLCCFGIFAAMFVAAKVTRHPVIVTIAAGAATSAVPSFVIWTTSGLENALFALAVTALAAVLARAAVDGRLLTFNTALGSGLLAALAALTRPDGVVYAAAFPLAVALTLERRTLRRALQVSLAELAAFALPVATYLVWRLVTFGDYLPNTARAKEQGLPSVNDLNKPGELAGYAGWLAVCLGAAAVAVTLVRPSPIRTAVTMVLITLGLAMVSYVLLQPDWMVQYRFATPVWPLAAITIALSAAHIAPKVSARGRIVAIGLAALAVISSSVTFRLSDIEFRAEPTVGVCNVAQNTGYNFNGYADILGVREGTLLAVDGGGTSLTSRLRFIDLSGLADRRIARLWQTDDMLGLRNYILDDIHPTFIKLFHGWAERDRLALIDDPRLARDYVLMFSGQAGRGTGAAQCGVRRRLTHRCAVVGPRHVESGDGTPPARRSAGLVVRRCVAARALQQRFACTVTATFFSLMIIGLANTLPSAMSTGLQEQGVSATVAHEVSNLPPVGSLFAAFLGYNPIEELLEPSGALHQPGVNAEVLTGQTFFPHLIIEPFHTGLGGGVRRRRGDDVHRRGRVAVRTRAATRRSIRAYHSDGVCRIGGPVSRFD